MADLSITAASVLKSGNAAASTGIAAATITQGQAVYVLAAGTIGLADSNASSPANTCAGISLNAASSGQPIQYCALDSGFTPGATLTSGAVIYLSNTAGGLTATYADIANGSTVITVGVATSTTTMNLAPVTGGVK